MKLDAGLLVRYMKDEPVRKFEQGVFKYESRRQTEQFAVITYSPKTAHQDKGLYKLVTLTGRRLPSVRAVNFHRTARPLRGDHLMLWQGGEKRLYTDMAERYNLDLNHSISAQRFAQSGH